MNKNTFVFITVDLSQQLEDYTIEEYTKHHGMSIDVKSDLDRDFDVLFSDDKVLHRRVRTSFKPTAKFNQKQVLKLRESLDKLDLDLNQTISSLLADDDSFVHIKLLNKLSYSQLEQLALLTATQNHFISTIKQEITICIDERVYERNKHYMIQYIVDNHIFINSIENPMQNPIPNTQFLPLYASFSRKVKGLRCQG